MKSKLLDYCIFLLPLFFLSCDKKTTCPPTEFESAAAELQNILKGDGASFTKSQAIEDDDTQVTILKSKNENETFSVNATKLNEGVTLGAFRVKNKKNSRTDTYRTVLVAKDTSVFLRIINTDDNSEEKISFTTKRGPVDPIGPPDPKPCDMGACFDDFDVNILPGLQAQANSSCQNVFTCIPCFDSSGKVCAYALYVIKPNSWRCLSVIKRDFKYYAIKTLPLIVRDGMEN